jgi:hypothetical protein
MNHIHNKFYAALNARYYASYTIMTEGMQHSKYLRILSDNTQSVARCVNDNRDRNIEITHVMIEENSHLI